MSNFPTLDGFLRDAMARRGLPSNAYVAEPGFDALYVRWTRRILENEMRWVLDVALVEVTDKGRGVFSNFLRRMEERGLSVYVESVHNVRLPRKLLSLGFQQDPWNPMSFYKLGRSKRQ